MKFYATCQYKCGNNNDSNLSTTNNGCSATNNNANIASNKLRNCSLYNNCNCNPARGYQNAINLQNCQSLLPYGQEGHRGCFDRLNGVTHNDFLDCNTEAANQSPASSLLLYGSCPQLSEYRSLPRNLYSAIRNPHQQQLKRLPQKQNTTELRSNSEQELRRSFSGRNKTKSLILCNKCAV